VSEALQALVAEGLVVAGRLLPDDLGPHYCWAARWKGQEERASREAVRRVTDAQSGEAAPPGTPLSLSHPDVLAYNRFLLEEYTPPPTKRLLVLLQCSVRRPFSTSPSHAAFRRALKAATGFDPRTEAHQCPVHVVVLASRIGPVPYDLESTYPASVGGGGVKHFSPVEFAEALPVLARRMADYLCAHQGSYDHACAFGEGRYGEVLAAAKLSLRAAGHPLAPMPVFPWASGPHVRRLGDRTPLKYWDVFWIQLALEAMSWLTEDQQQAAHRRLVEMGVEYG
jgi:hypothetical protein